MSLMDMHVSCLAHRHQALSSISITQHGLITYITARGTRTLQHHGAAYAHVLHTWFVPGVACVCVGMMLSVALLVWNIATIVQSMVTCAWTDTCMCVAYDGCRMMHRRAVMRVLLLH